MTAESTARGWSAAVHLDADLLRDPRRLNADIRDMVGRPVDLDSLRDLADGPVPDAGRHLRSILVTADPMELIPDEELLLVVLDGRAEAIDVDAEERPRARLVGEGQTLAVPAGGTVVLRASASARPSRVLEIHFAGHPAPAGSKVAVWVGEVPPLPDYYYGYDERYAAVYAAGAETWEPPEPNDVLRRVLDALEIRACTVIDLGCGEGRDAIYLAGRGFTVTAVDVSRAALDKGRERARFDGVDVEFLERDVIYLDNLPRGTFDLALNMGCLHMIPDPHLRAAHLRGVHDLLRPGGRFVLAHCRQRWLEGFFSVPDYEAVGPVVPGPGRAATNPAAGRRHGHGAAAAGSLQGVATR